MSTHPRSSFSALLPASFPARSALAACLAAFVPSTLGLSSAAAAAVPKPTQILAKAAAESRTGQFYPRQDGTAAGPRRCEAPRLVLTTAEGKTELVPLKETSADVHIAGAVADVQVHQVFENTGTHPIEALYVFPASTRAAVHAMRMKIGGRTIEAQIDRKKAARETFERARQAGQRASLLEEERPNVFTMRVTNIMPKDRIDVTLDYSELLVPEDATYEFVYPTVVGPRYKGGVEPHKNAWMSSPTLPEGQAAPYKFGLKAHLETGVPLKELSSPSHHITTSAAGLASTDVVMDDAAGGNRDFVLRYRLSGDRIESGVLLAPPDARDEGAGTFAVMMEPPRAPKLKELPPREYLFLFDVSGSMHGFPLDTAKELMRKLLPQLRPSDSFDVALFSGAAYVLNPTGSLPATTENVHHALEIIERQQGGGGTELMGGLEMTYRIPKRDPGISRTVVVVTDGYVGVEAQAFRFVREHLGEANLFAFGIGSSVNRGLIEGLARAGLGEPFVVLDTSEAAAQAEKLRKLIEEPVLTHISVTFKGLDTSELSPAAMPDLLSRRPLILLGQYRGAPSGTVTITGLAGGHTPFRQEIALGQGQVRTENAPLRSLWARRWVTVLEDEHALSGQASLEEGITQIGLHYHLLTPFTSFVAVDSEIANRTGGQKNVTQPLPLPEGVSQLAAEPAAVSGMMSLHGQGVAGGGLGSGSGYLARPASGMGSIGAVKRKAAVADEALAGPVMRSAKPVPAPAPPPAASQPSTSAARGKGGDDAPAAGSDSNNDKDVRSEKEAKRHGGAETKSDANKAPRDRAAAVTLKLSFTGWPQNEAPKASAAKAQLMAALRTGGCPTTGAFVVKLVLDAQGRITQVVWMKGDRAIQSCVTRQWSGVTLVGAAGTTSLVVTVTQGT